MLENSETQVLKRKVSPKCPVKEVKCPRGLQEAEFLNLLGFSFPQLAGKNKPFDVFTADRNRRLQPLKLKALTPEEIHNSMKSAGRGKSVIYIRLKAGEEHQASEEELYHLQRKDDTTKESPSTSIALMAGSHSNSIQRVERNNDLTSQQQQMETGEDNGEERLVSEPSDFLALSAAKWDLESSDEDEKQDDGGKWSNRDKDWKPDESGEDPTDSEPEPHSPNTKKQQTKRSCFRTKRQKLIKSSPKTVNENSFLECRICGDLHRSTNILIKHAWKHVDHPGCLCVVCGEHMESVEALKAHLKSHQETHDCPICGKSFISTVGLNGHVAMHAGERPYKCDICHKAFTQRSGLRNHHWVHVVDKPHKCDICHKAFSFKAQVKAHRKIHVGDKLLSCHLCGKSFCYLRALSQHRLTHTGEKRYGCQVCGKRFTLPVTLKAHEKIHTVRDRPYLCDICCKTFHSNELLKSHQRTHSKERPTYRCSECTKDFSSKGGLTSHMRIHTGETPFRCPECGRAFKRKTYLDNHLRVHSGQKPFVCGVCGKASSRLEHLTVHMRTHNGERPYQCTVCDKAFTQSHCLKTHMKSHQAGEKSSSGGSKS